MSSTQRLVERACTRAIGWLVEGEKKEGVMDQAELLLGMLLPQDAIDIEREWSWGPQYADDIFAELADRVMLNLISELHDALPRASATVDGAPVFR